MLLPFMDAIFTNCILHVIFCYELSFCRLTIHYLTFYFKTVILVQRSIDLITSNQHFQGVLRKKQQLIF